METLLEIKNIKKTFENTVALTDVSFNVKKGEIFGLLGPNGAGKTTLIRIINRIFAPDSGEILFNNKPLDEETVKKIGYLPEERGLYMKMKIKEQAIFFGMLKGLSQAEAKKRLYQWLEKFSIPHWDEKKPEELSKGMQQKIQFIITVLHEPDLLILDEPFTGFDPINTELIKKQILEFKKQGKTIIFSTHNMASVEEICDRIVLINKGKKLVESPIEALKKQFDKELFGLKTDKSIELESTKFFEVIDKNEANNYFVLRMKSPYNSNDFVSYLELTKNARIREFKALLPSLHEIFIELVKQSENK